MANAAIPFGLRPFDSYEQSGQRGKPTMVFIPASVNVPLGIGDPCKTLAATGVDTALGCPAVTRAAAGDTIRGIFTGFDQVYGVANANFSLNRKHRPASVAMYGFIDDSPSSLFLAVMDTSAAWDNAYVGENVDLATVADCNTTTGYSTVVLSTTSHTTSSAQIRIVKVYNAPDNEYGASVVVVCMINESELKGTAGV